MIDTEKDKGCHLLNYPASNDDNYYILHLYTDGLNTDHVTHN